MIISLWQNVSSPGFNLHILYLCWDSLFFLVTISSIGFTALYCWVSISLFLLCQICMALCIVNGIVYSVLFLFSNKAILLFILFFYKRGLARVLTSPQGLKLHKSQDITNGFRDYYEILYNLPNNSVPSNPQDRLSVIDDYHRFPSILHR